MLLHNSYFNNNYFILFLCLCHGYFIVLVNCITVAHQLPIDILPPISSKKDKTLWIGGKYIFLCDDKNELNFIF